MESDIFLAEYIECLCLFAPQRVFIYEGALFREQPHQGAIFSINNQSIELQLQTMSVVSEIESIE